MTYSIESLASKVAEAIKSPDDIKTFVMVLGNELFEFNGPKALKLLKEEIANLEDPIFY